MQQVYLLSDLRSRSSADLLHLCNALLTTYRMVENAPRQTKHLHAGRLPFRTIGSLDHDLCVQTCFVMVVKELREDLLEVSCLLPSS